MFRRLALGAAALLTAGGLAVATPGATPAAVAASADGHLVYVKGGNVWVSRPDGTGQVRVTSDGGYSDPSMSDNGRIAAVRGSQLVVLRPNGTRLAQFKLPGLFVEGSCSTISITPPLDAVISPDGTKVAWSQLRTSQCGGRLVIDDLTAITDAVPTGAVRLRGLVLGYSPSWVGNNKVVVDDEAVMHLVPVGHPEPKGISWFSAYDLHNTFSYDLNSPAVSRDGSRVAYLMDHDPERIYDHATSGNPVTSNQPGTPSTSDLCVAATNIPRPDEGPVLDELMFSPDGDSMVVGDNGDVTVIGGVGGSCEERTYTSPLTNVEDVFWSGYTGNVSAPAPDRVAPTVKITKVVVKKRTAKVTFRASDNVTPASGLRLRCQVDKGKKTACRSPQTFRGLKKGTHTVRVWATDKAGNTRSTSARFRVRR